MPFFHFYGEFAEEEEFGRSEASRRDGFQYAPSSAQFKTGELKGVAATALQLLQEAGATEMRVRYDGGSDEGFAHADDVWIGGDRKVLDEIVDLLLTPQNLQRIRDAASAPAGSYWHEAAKHYDQHELRRVISDALDELGHEIASQLLGHGYGTGEYELYGALIVNLGTGEILDDPVAQPPM